MSSVASPLFQQGEHVIRRGEAIRYYKGKGGWSNSNGTIWLTNQRIVYWAGFGNQRNWPLDHIVKVQSGVIDTVNTVCVEFDNGMVEWFALDEQGLWLEAIRSASKVSARRFAEAPTRSPLPPVPPQPDKPALIKRRSTPRGIIMLALAATFSLCGCALIVAAGLVFLKVFQG